MTNRDASVPQGQVPLETLGADLTRPRQRTAPHFAGEGTALLRHFGHQRRQSFGYTTRDLPEAERLEFARLLLKYADCTARLPAPGSVKGPRNIRAAPDGGAPQRERSGGGRSRTRDVRGAPSGGGAHRESGHSRQDRSQVRGGNMPPPRGVRKCS